MMYFCVNSIGSMLDSMQECQIILLKWALGFIAAGLSK